MNIKQLSKLVRYELRCNNTVCIYKNGRSWSYQTFNQLDKRSVTVTEDYKNIDKLYPMNFIIDNYNKKFWDYSSIESMKKSIQAMQNAVKNTKDLDSNGISNNMKSDLRLITHFIDNTLNKNDTIKNGLIKNRYVSDGCCFYEIPKEYCQYVKKAKNHPMEDINFSDFILKNSNGIIETFKKDELQFIDDGTKLDSKGTKYIEVDGEKINYKTIYVNMLKLYDNFDYTIQLIDIKGNVSLSVLIDNNPVCLLLPIVSYGRDGKVKKEEPKKEEPKEEPKETIDNIKDDFMKKTVNADRVKENMSTRVKEEFKKDLDNNLDIKESITLRISRLLRDNNLHGHVFYIPLETEVYDGNRFNIVNNELRHNDRNVLIDTDRLTYRDYCNIEDIINNLIKIKILYAEMDVLKDYIIDKYLDINYIDKDNEKAVFDFKVSLRKNEDTKFLYKMYRKFVYLYEKDIQKTLDNLTIYNDYLNYKLNLLDD